MVRGVHAWRCLTRQFRALGVDAGGQVVIIFFSAQGDPLTGTGAGPGIDDVKLTTWGSPYISSPPSAPLVAIPVRDPQPDTSLAPGSYPGVTIVADPFTPPGADQ